MRSLRRAGDILLTVAAVLGVLGAALFVGVRLGAVQPLVVTSGSMQPVFDAGDVLVTRPVPAGELHPGDVASLVDDGGRLITHRVLDVSPSDADGTVVVRMQGDANDAPDPAPYTVETALVPVVRVPGIGPVVAAVQRPTVAIPGLVAVGALVGIAMLSGRPPETADAAVGDEAPEEARH
jgi:signal peptidase